MISSQTDMLRSCMRPHFLIYGNPQVLGQGLLVLRDHDVPGLRPKHGQRIPGLNEGLEGFLTKDDHKGY